MKYLVKLFFGLGLATQMILLWLTFLAIILVSAGSVTITDFRYINF